MFNKGFPTALLGSSSGKQKKVHSISQLHFRRKNNPAKNEADQMLLAHQTLSGDSFSVNSNNNIKRISKIPKSLTTTRPNFDGNLKKNELFEDLFQKRAKPHNQLTENDEKKTYSIPLFVLMCFGRVKTSTVEAERIWEKN